MTEEGVIPGAADAADPRGRDGGALIGEMVREGVRWMLAEALQAEVDAYMPSSVTSVPSTDAGW